MPVRTIIALALLLIVDACASAPQTATSASPSAVAASAAVSASPSELASPTATPSESGAATASPSASAVTEAATGTPPPVLATAAPTRVVTPTPAPTPRFAAVVYLNFTANPATLQITRGTTVVWTNMDGASHTATSGAMRQRDGIFDSGTIAPNGRFSFTFNTAGTFAYFCSFHASMTGYTIVVR